MDLGLSQPPRYTTRFTLTARAYTPAPEVEGEIRASLDRLKDLLPADVDLAAHPTLLFVVGNLYVPGTVNRNGDGVWLADGIRVHRGFEWQQINLEHNRGEVKGFIIKAGLSELGTDRLITEEEALAAGKPCNVAVVIALWKQVDRDLAKYILNEVTPGSLSLSFEVGFDHHDIVTIPKGTINLSMATVVARHGEEGFAAWDKRLRVNKGSGVTKDGQQIARVIVGRIIPMGGGIVAVPAGAVNGISAITPQDRAPEADEDEDVQGGEGLDNGGDETEAGMYSYSSTQCTLSPEAAAPFLAYGMTIPEEHLYHSDNPERDGRYGRESEPHVTVRYGLTGTDAAPVQLSVTGCGPVRARLGKVSSFENADKPYDVLYAEVVSEDLHHLNALVKASCECVDTHPVYTPHLTLAYVRKGLAQQYVGDTRFEGQELTFSSITFSPHTGERVEIPLMGAAQTEAAVVYSLSEPADLGSALASMPSQPTRLLKLSAGWQEKVVALQASAGEAGLAHGIDVTLSDGRSIKAMRVVDAATLGSDIEVSYDGVVITSMTPGVANPNYVAPGKADVYPTCDEAARAKQQAAVAEKHKAQSEPYVGASVAEASVVAQRTDDAVAKALAVINTILNCTNTATASVSPNTASSNTLSTPSIMDLDTLKQAVAAVKSPEDLPAVMASVAQFADIIAKASEEQAAAKLAAETSAKQAQATLSEVQAQLATLTKSHNDLIAAQQAAAAEQTFQTRMASVEELFAFDDETRADVMTEVKACADDTAFTAYVTKAKRLYKGWLKTATASTAAAGENPFAKKGEEDKAKDGEKKDDEACASASKTALASAAANVVDAPISNTVDAALGGKSLKQQLMAVASKNTRIGGETVEVLTARASAPKRTS